jgi:hypothetical protein
LCHFLILPHGLYQLIPHNMSILSQVSISNILDLIFILNLESFAKVLGRLFIVHIQILLLLTALLITLLILYLLLRVLQFNRYLVLY